MNRVSPDEHCKLRHDSTKLKSTEQKIKDCMIKGVLMSDYMYIKIINITHIIFDLIIT